MLDDAEGIRDRLIAFQAEVRRLIVGSRTSADLHAIDRVSSADTIYRIDTVVDPVLESFCRDWAEQTPLVLIAEGLQDERGNEGLRVFPQGAMEEDAVIRVIVDPIDGTRGLMYDKRSAWALAGVAPNRGKDTCLKDIEIAVMTELPTSKMGQSDVLWAIKGRGAFGRRIDLSTGDAKPLTLTPSKAVDLRHGFASVANFFPGTKVLASQLMESLAEQLLGSADVSKASIFDDQYISTGGQFYELIVGHDRFIADLRPLFYKVERQPAGLCCHPYDCAAMLIAEEAGVIITDGIDKPLNGPLDTTTGLSWAGFANRTLAQQLQPLIRTFLSRAGLVSENEW